MTWAWTRSCLGRKGNGREGEGPEGWDSGEVEDMFKVLYIIESKRPYVSLHHKKYKVKFKKKASSFLLL